MWYKVSEDYMYAELAHLFVFHAFEIIHWYQNNPKTLFFFSVLQTDVPFWKKKKDHFKLHKKKVLNVTDLFSLG